MVCIGTAVQATRQRAATRPGGASGGIQEACARNTMGGGATHGAAWGVFKAGLRGAQGASPRPVAVRLCLHVQHERGNGHMACALVERAARAHPAVGWGHGPPTLCVCGGAQALGRWLI